MGAVSGRLLVEQPVRPPELRSITQGEVIITPETITIPLSGTIIQGVTLTPLRIDTDKVERTFVKKWAMSEGLKDSGLLGSFQHFT